MKKLLAKLSALSGLALAASVAHAVEQPYLGVDYIQSTYEIAGGADASPTMAQLRFGADMTKHLGLEARVALGVDGDTYAVNDVNNTTYDINIDGAYTLSLVGRLPWAKHASLYAHVGYSFAKVTSKAISAPSPGSTSNDDGLSYGAGLVLPAWRQYQLEVDYTSYFDNEKYTFSGVSVGVRRYL